MPDEVLELCSRLPHAAYALRQPRPGVWLSASRLPEVRKMHLGLSYKDYVIKKIGDNNYENIKDYQQYLRGYDYTGKIPVIIDFYATWCGPCQALAPMLKRLADEYEGRVKVLKVDVDKNQALAAAARIQSIPTLFFITKDGDIERIVGGLPYQELVRMAEKISE